MRRERAQNVSVRVAYGELPLVLPIALLAVKELAWKERVPDTMYVNFG